MARALTGLVLLPPRPAPFLWRSLPREGTAHNFFATTPVQDEHVLSNAGQVFVHLFQHGCQSESGSPKNAQSPAAHGRQTGCCAAPPAAPTILPLDGTPLMERAPIIQRSGGCGSDCRGGKPVPQGERPVDGVFSWHSHGTNCHSCHRAPWWDWTGRLSLEPVPPSDPADFGAVLLAASVLGFTRSSSHCSTMRSFVPFLRRRPAMLHSTVAVAPSVPFRSDSQCAVRSYRVRDLGGSRTVPDGRSYPPALPAASSVCRGYVATTKEPRRELFQRLLPDQRRELRRHKCFNVGTFELRCSSHTELQRLRRCSGGHRGTCALGWSGELRASAKFPDAARVSSVGSTMTGSARSSSDAPVCASLERAASAKSSPLLLAWVADNRQCSGLRAAAPSPSQRLDRRPPRLREQELHRRVSSMLSVSPATTGYVWRAKPVSTRAPRASARRSGSGQTLYTQSEGGLLSAVEEDS